MVGKLKVLHPEFAQRLQRAAKVAGIRRADMARLPGISFEMARRYWIGAAKPRGKKIASIASLLAITPAELEYGQPKLRAEEQRASYDIVGGAAMEVARAWSKLSPSLQRLYRDSIFRDAATEKVMPWLKTLIRPAGSSYDSFEKSVERDYEQHLKQMKLDL